MLQETRYKDLPKETLEIIKDVLLTVLGTTTAAARAEGCEAVVNQARE